MTLQNMSAARAEPRACVCSKAELFALFNVQVQLSSRTVLLPSHHTAAPWGALLSLQIAFVAVTWACVPAHIAP